MLKQLHHPTDLLFFRILNEEAKNSDFIDFGGARSPQEEGYRVGKIYNGDGRVLSPGDLDYNVIGVE